MQASNRHPWRAWLLAFGGVWAALLAWEKFLLEISLPAGLQNSVAIVAQTFKNRPNSLLILGSSRAANYDPWRISTNTFVLSVPGLPFPFQTAMIGRLAQFPGGAPLVLDLHEEAAASEVTFEYACHSGLIQIPEILAVLEEHGQLSWYRKVPGLRFYGEGMPILYRHLRFWHRRHRLQFLQGRIVDAAFDPAKPPSRPDRVAPELAAFLNHPSAHPGERFAYTAGQRSQLTNAIGRLAPRKVVIARTPRHPLVWRSAAEASVGEFLRQLASLPNVTILDYSRLTLGDHAYNDPFHMNAWGASQFTQRFAEDLRRLAPAAFP